MKRDTRANLIFLGVFLAISLPGAVILFKKKLDPSLRPSYLPPAAPTRLAYVDPREAPDLTRYVPPLTGRWVAEQARARGVSALPSRDGLPVMSGGRLVQVVDASTDGASVTATLLVWRAAEVVKVAGRGAELSIVDLPQDVRRELIVAGFSNPPKKVVWAVTSVQRLTESGVSRTLPLEIDGQRDSVTIFTK